MLDALEQAKNSHDAAMAEAKTTGFKLESLRKKFWDLVGYPPIPTFRKLINLLSR